MMKGIILAAVCAALVVVSIACSSAKNTNISNSNTNSTASTGSTSSAAKENSITVTSEGTKYLDGATLPDNNGSMQTEPYAQGQRFRLVLRLTSAARSDITGFAAEATPTSGGPIDKVSANVVGYDSTLSMEFPNLPLGNESKLAVWAFPKAGGAPVLVASGKVFVGN